MIELMQGSIFDTKCDLVIIPCDTTGSVDTTIHKELTASNLPNFRKSMPVGDIEFIGNTESFSNAQMIGYAAIRDKGKSSTNKDTLQAILNKIKIVGQKRSIRKINIPLFAVGTSSPSVKEPYAAMKDIFDEDNTLQLYIYTQDTQVYNELSKSVNDKKTLPAKTIPNPRVFISYTGTDAENDTWVQKFACELRDNGVDARIDTFRLQGGEDLPQWMTNEIIMADKVILICDKFYADKADNRKGGVGWETMIIQGDMLFNQGHNKYIAILRDEDINQCLPIYIKSKYALNWSKINPIKTPFKDSADKAFQELLLYLFDCSNETPLGDVPECIRKLLHH